MVCSYKGMAWPCRLPKFRSFGYPRKPHIVYNTLTISLHYITYVCASPAALHSLFIPSFLYLPLVSTLQLFVNCKFIFLHTIKIHSCILQEESKMEHIWDKDYLDDEDEDEEALSLSDLPLLQRKCNQDEGSIIDDLRSLSREPQIQRIEQIQHDFDFCSVSKESEMCAADEVFFQGQILPLHRHSISSDRGFGSANTTLPISRSESMDRFHPGGLLISSRSSSTSSSSAASIPKFRPRLNQFHSHPSPSPRIPFPGNKHPAGHRNLPKSSSIWNMFRLGPLVSPPVQDLRTRCPSNIRGSRNSRCSSTGSSSIAASIGSSGKTKARKLLAAAGGCRCSAVDAVAAVPTRVVTIKRSASEGEDEEDNRRRRRQQGETERTAGKEKQKQQRKAGKKQLSHHRTFEWIKQLSLEAAPESDN